MAWGIFDSKSSKSSTRFAVVLLALGIFLIFVAIFYYIIYTTRHPYIALYQIATKLWEIKMTPVDWVGLGLILTGIAGVIGVILWGKKINKAEETKSEKPE